MRKKRRWNQKKLFCHCRKKRRLNILTFLKRRFPVRSGKIYWIWNFRSMRRCPGERRSFFWSFAAASFRMICFWKSFMIKSSRHTTVPRIITLFWSMRCMMFRENLPTGSKCSTRLTKCMNICLWVSARCLCRKQDWVIMRKATAFRIG